MADRLRLEAGQHALRIAAKAAKKYRNASRIGALVGRQWPSTTQVADTCRCRPQQKWQYAERADLATLGAAWAFGLVKNHPYRDDNRRVGFLAIVTFLEINGHDFVAADADVVAGILALADGTISEEALTEWIRHHSSKLR